MSLFLKRKTVMIRWIIIHCREVVRWFYWVPLKALAARLPASIAYSLMEMAGPIMMLLNYGKVRDMKRWVAGMAGSERHYNEVSEVRRSFVLYCKNALDSLRYSKLSSENIYEMVDFIGLENLDKALSMNKGAIIIYPHFGNEEFLMPALGYKGYKVNQVASRWEPEYFQGKTYMMANAIRRHAWRMRIGTREKLPVKFIYIDKGVREIFRVLNEKEVVLLAIDGREGKNWEEVTFLGKKAIISTGPMKLALSTGAPVLPTLIMRNHLYRHTLVICEPYTLMHTGNEDEDIRANTEGVLAVLDPYVRKHISEYAKFVLFGVKLFVDKDNRINN